MSEEAKLRTMQDVQQEYFRTCAELGDLDYRESQIPSQRQNLQDKLYRLNKENEELSQSSPVVNGQSE